MKLLFCMVLVLGATLAQATIPEEKIHYIDRLMRGFVNHHLVPCFTTGFLWKDEPKWVGAYGKGADIENHVPCSDKAMMRVASVSKAIGSGLVGTLVQSGKLNWDDNVHDYLSTAVYPKKTFNGKPVNITIRELISHVAGMRHSNDHDLLHDWEFRITNSTQLLNWFKDEPLLYEPGHKYHYANHDWSMLAAIIEAVEKRPYYIVLNEFMHNIGMEKARSDNRNELIPHRVAQYQVLEQNGRKILVPPPIQDDLRPFPHWPAGGVISNVHDLLVYGKQMLKSYKASKTIAETILNSTTVHEMWTYKQPFVAPSKTERTVAGHKFTDITSEYALGWERLEFPEEKVDPLFSKLFLVSHNGQIGGVSSIIGIVPEHDFVFAALSNLGGVSNFLNPMLLETLHVLLLKG